MDIAELKRERGSNGRRLMAAVTTAGEREDSRWVYMRDWVRESLMGYYHFEKRKTTYDLGLNPSNAKILYMNILIRLTITLSKQ